MKRIAVRYLAYSLLKYLLFYIVLYTVVQPVQWNWAQLLETFEHFFFTLWILGFVPLVEAVVFVGPFSFTLSKAQGNKRLIPYLALLLTLELFFPLLFGFAVELLWIRFLANAAVAITLFYSMIFQRMQNAAAT